MARAEVRAAVGTKVRRSLGKGRVGEAPNRTMPFYERQDIKII